MNNEEPKTRDIDDILELVAKYIASGKSITAEKWMDVALNLLSLQDPENTLLIDLEQAYEKKKDEFLNEDMPVNRATTKAKLTDEYREYALQRLKIDKINEMVKAAKKYADVNEFR